MRDPTDQFDLPDHLTWQMNLALEHNGLSSGASGILGETQVTTVDADGNPIMQGMDSIRGTQEDCELETCTPLCGERKSAECRIVCMKPLKTSRRCCCRGKNVAP